MKDLEAAVREGRCILIDVREKHEHEAGHIPLSVNHPLSKLESLCDSLALDRLIVLYCRSGGRSRKAANALASRGFQSVQVLEGGYSAWSRSAAADQ